jgi:uncharacterized protein YeaO (DUF488 family)
MTIKVKRAYVSPSRTDGTRVLVDRLWPRGISRETAKLDLWLKEIAPSAELCHWFGHDPARWAQFRDRYFRELDENPGAVEQLRALVRQGPLTLVYSARDEEHNNAVALREYLTASASTE